MGPFAHHLESHFLSNSDTRAVNCILQHTKVPNFFWNSTFQACLAAETDLSPASRLLEIETECSPNDKVTLWRNTKRRITVQHVIVQASYHQLLADSCHFYCSPASSLVQTDRDGARWLMQCWLEEHKHGVYHLKVPDHAFLSSAQTKNFAL